MTIDVLLFAKARDLFGSSVIALSLPENATAGDVWVELCKVRAGLENALPSARLAVNQQFATSDTPVSVGDEVALIPAVSGG